MGLKMYVGALGSAVILGLLAIDLSFDFAKTETELAEFQSYYAHHHRQEVERSLPGALFVPAAIVVAFASLVKSMYDFPSLPTFAAFGLTVCSLATFLGLVIPLRHALVAIAPDAWDNLRAAAAAMALYHTAILSMMVVAVALMLDAPLPPPPPPAAKKDE